jgi:hypothetical protein
MTSKQVVSKYKMDLIGTTLVALTLFGCAVFQPSPTPQPACSVESVLNTLRNSDILPGYFPEYSVNQSRAAGVSYLNIWYVDPAIDLDVNSENLKENLFSARVSASIITIAAQANDPCTALVFDRINPVVVDRAYNGWFSASIPVSLVPENFPPSAQEGVDVVNAFDVVYYRQVAPASILAAPTGSCSWPETKERLQTHFDPSRSNVDFYFVGDEVSRKVTAQWDGSINTPEDFDDIYETMISTAQELDCLYPAPDFLDVMVLEGDGNMVFYGRLPYSGSQSIDLSQLQVLYQAEIPR